MSSSFGNIRRGVIALAGLLAIAPAALAQSITDARRVEFTPSTDHSAVDPTTGVALVTNYSLQIFPAGGATPVRTANLGKPAPEGDGMIRVDFVSLLSSPLTPGPTSQSLAPGGGNGTVAVTTTAGCNWTATSGASWVTITSGATGSGSGSVTFTAASNTTSQTRTATLTIAGKSFVITEASATIPLPPSNLRLIR